MRTSDLLLLVIPDVAGSNGILTGKLFEYLASRRTILCIGPRAGDAAGIIKDCAAGETFERTDGLSLSNHLSALLSGWSNSRAVTTESRTFEKYSRRNLTNDLAKVLA